MQISFAYLHVSYASLQQLQPNFYWPVLRAITAGNQTPVLPVSFFTLPRL